MMYSWNCSLYYIYGIAKLKNKISVRIFINSNIILECIHWQNLVLDIEERREWVDSFLYRTYGQERKTDNTQNIIK
jgi:hypothetical protein